jgi:hypothetical protein
MAMFFSTTKAGHLGQILIAGLFGQVLGNSLTPPDPSTIEQYGHLIIQALVAIVTIWATIRKALQKPHETGKGPATAVVPGTTLPVPPILPTRDGNAE